MTLVNSALAPEGRTGAPERAAQPEGRDRRAART
jgi:hypothetical protein